MITEFIEIVRDFTSSMGLAFFGILCVLTVPYIYGKLKPWIYYACVILIYIIVVILPTL